MNRLGPLLLLALAFVAATPARSLAGKKFSSSYVELLEGSAISWPGGGSSIVVGLGNRKDTPLWVRVRFQTPAGATSCDSTRLIASKGRAMLGCAQDTLVADTDYAFTVSVYTDSSLSQAVDEGSSTIRFHGGDLKVFARLNEAAQLPRTYEHVVHTQKLGLGAMMMPGGSGSRLIVNPDGLEYAADKGAIKIAASQMTAVKLAPGGSYGPWLVVQYEVSGEKKLLGLRPSATNGSASIDLIRASIDQLFSSTLGK